MSSDATKTMYAIVMKHKGQHDRHNVIVMSIRQTLFDNSITRSCIYATREEAEARIKEIGGEQYMEIVAFAMAVLIDPLEIGQRVETIRDLDPGPPDAVIWEGEKGVITGSKLTVAQRIQVDFDKDPKHGYKHPRWWMTPDDKLKTERTLIQEVFV